MGPAALPLGLLHLSPFERPVFTLTGFRRPSDLVKVIRSRASRQPVLIGWASSIAVRYRDLVKIGHAQADRFVTW